jgi:hypothetical protein
VHVYRLGSEQRRLPSSGAVLLRSYVRERAVGRVLVELQLTRDAADLVDVGVRSEIRADGCIVVLANPPKEPP